MEDRVSLPDIVFYVPRPELVESVPASIDGYWYWVVAWLERHDNDDRWDGPFSWTIQTYIHLRDAGFPCALAAEMPATGIVVAHSNFFSRDLKPSAERYLVEIKPDRPMKCPFANAYVTQNKSDPYCAGEDGAAYKSYPVPYWPQPCLKPRDESRGERFENVAFVGNIVELSEELHSGVDEDLARLGLTWEIVERQRWHDYRHLDAVVAIRRPDEHRERMKPATKLYNAWLAGVPAILSPDSAYQEIRLSPLDYLIARNRAELLDQLRFLKNNPKSRFEMVAHGRQRAREFSAARVTEAWRTLLTEEIVPDFLVWRRSSEMRDSFFSRRKAARRARKASRNRG